MPMPYDARSTSRGAVLFPATTLAAAGLSNDDVVKLRTSWTAITIQCPGSCLLSALVMHFEPTQQGTVRPRTGRNRGRSE